MTLDEREKGAGLFSAKKTVQIENVQTVDCPIHHLPLDVQTMDKVVDDNENPGKTKTIILKFAVCNCAVEDNPYRNRRVWEQS